MWALARPQRGGVILPGWKIKLEESIAYRRLDAWKIVNSGLAVGAMEGGAVSGLDFPSRAACNSGALEVIDAHISLAQSSHKNTR